MSPVSLIFQQQETLDRFMIAGCGELKVTNDYKTDYTGQNRTVHKIQTTSEVTA